VQTDQYDKLSKRSVERHYQKKEIHFQRYFVSKPQRRNALVNRAYWLRMKAVDVLVKQFLDIDSPEQVKVVINLGCGRYVRVFQPAA
jgi:tRNA wybutosine-synthesizing protein 4